MKACVREAVEGRDASGEKKKNEGKEKCWTDYYHSRGGGTDTAKMDNSGEDDENKEVKWLWGWFYFFFCLIKEEENNTKIKKSWLHWHKKGNDNSDDDEKKKVRWL